MPIINLPEKKSTNSVVSIKNDPGFAGYAAKPDTGENVVKTLGASEKSNGAEKQFERLFEAAGCRTQTELADILGIRQSSIAVAKRRNRLPSDWLLKLLRLRSINPDWIIFGSGPKFLLPSDGLDLAEIIQEPISLRGLDGLIMQRILGCFRARDLQTELVRRKKKGDTQRTRLPETASK